MNINSFSRRFSRLTLAVLMLSTCFMCFSGVTAFAAVDLDVTLVPPEDSVTNSSDCEVKLEILTKSDNGYVEMLINIEYDEDLMRLAAPVNQNGYRVVGSKGQLTLNYTDPTGTNTPTPIGNKEVISIHFTVLEDAPDTTTKIRATVHHAYNKKGKNVTWTPIYDKTIEIVRINQDTASSATESEEVSSQFVVGGTDNLVNRSSGGAVAGNAGKVASVIIGAIVIFSAGMAAGNIFCMKKYGISPHSAKSADDEYYDDEIYDSGRRRRQSPDKHDDEDDDEYGSGYEESYYTRPGDDYTVGGDEDYLTAVPVSRNADDSISSYFGSSSSIGSHSAGSSDSDDPFSSRSRKKNSDGDDDDYPELFASMPRSAPRTPSASPNLDDLDTIFGKYSGNVERNVDDGYGGISSSRTSRDYSGRSERSRRNR